MTDDKKHEDKDRKKVSDEELEDVAGGNLDAADHLLVESSGIRKDKKSRSCFGDYDVVPGHAR